MTNCETQILRRKHCHDLLGKNNEDCLIQELEEKRCLAFQYCPQEAEEYYGTPKDRDRNNYDVLSFDDENIEELNQNSKIMKINKAMCASWAESFCFANPSIVILDEGIRDHHLRAQKIVNENSYLKSKCRTIAMDLARCLRIVKSEKSYVN